MATFQCVSMPQFITPSPSTSADIQITSNDSDSGERFASVSMSENGSSDPTAIANEGIRQEFFRNFLKASGASVGMRGLETSDDGGSTSSRQTPPEYPSPPPPSNSPPDSMSSLQAESPIGDEYTQSDVVEGNASSGVDFSVLSKDEQLVKINEWIVQQGYHPVPYDKTIEHGPGMVFVHVLDGELKLNMCKDKKGISITLEGPGTILMVGASGHVPQAAPFKLAPDQQCHQFLDPDGRLLHVVLSNCHSEGVSQDLNVPKICRKQELMDAMGMSPSPPGPSERGSRSSGGRGRGNAKYSNGNGYHRNASGQNGQQSSSESADGSIRNENGYNTQSNADNGYQSQRYGNTYNGKNKNGNRHVYTRQGNGHHGQSNNRGFLNNKSNSGRGRGKHYGNENGERFGGNRGYSKHYNYSDNQYQQTSLPEFRQIGNQTFYQVGDPPYSQFDHQQYDQAADHQQFQQEDNQQNTQHIPQQYDNQQYYQPEHQQYHETDNQQYQQPKNQQNGQPWKPVEETINNNNALFGNLQQFPPLPSQSPRSEETDLTDSSETSDGKTNQHLDTDEAESEDTSETEAVPVPKGKFPSPNAPEFHPQGLLVPVQPQEVPTEVQQHPIILQQNGVPMQDMQMMVPVPMMHNMHDGMMMQPVYYQQPGPSMMVQPYMIPSPPKGMLVISAETQFINNTWVECDFELQKRVMYDILSEQIIPFQVNSLTTSVMFEVLPLPLAAFQYQRGVLQLPITSENDVALHVFLAHEHQYFKEFDAKFLPIDSQDGKRLFNITELKPNENYQISVFAKTLDNQFRGLQSVYHSFRTAPGRPEPPNRVHMTNRGLHFFYLKWEEGANYGSLICKYAIEIVRNGEKSGRVAFLNQKTLEVRNLVPQECYNIRLTAFNACGESMYGTEFKAFTKPNRAPTCPQNVKIVATSHRSIFITWDENPNVFVTIECYNNATKKVEIVRRDMGGNKTVVNNLLPSTQYQFRLKAANEFGEQWTKYFTCHTQKELPKLTENPNRRLSNYEKRQQARLRNPQPAPTFERYVLGFPVMIWNASGFSDEEYSYIIEGSTLEEQYKFYEIDRTDVRSYIVTDTKIQYVRIVRLGHNNERSYPSQPTELPWDRAYCKLERISGVSCSYTKEGDVFITWNRVNQERVPPTAAVFYYVRRCDIPLGNETELICVGDINECLLKNIPGKSSISVQVRACFVFNKKMSYGDWTYPYTLFTPRDLPTAVENVRPNLPSKILELSRTEDSTAPQIKVEATQLPIEASILESTDVSKDVVIEDVQPEEKSVTDIVTAIDGELAKVAEEISVPALIPAVTEINVSVSHPVEEKINVTTLPPVENEISGPALPPGAPKYLHVSNIQTNGCTVHWKALEPNGSPILGHNIHLMLNGKTIATHFIPIIENKTSCSFQLEKLKSCTDYTVVVCGKNEIGYGPRVEVAFITATQPPVVPEVWSSPEPHQLKVWWDDTSEDQDLVYKLVRINEKTKQETPVYQGDNLQTKVKGLKERTKYIFKLQVKDSRTGATSWSEAFEFQTTVAPPPPIKQQPTITLVPGETHLYKAEWYHCLSEQPHHNQMYQLQVADATVERAKWQTEYEGKTPRYNINTKNFTGALHFRVLVVRKEAGKDVTGSPSPVGYIANIPPVIEVAQAEVQVQESWLKQYPKRALACIPSKTVWLTVIILFVFMVTFSECIFHFITGKGNEQTTELPLPSPPASSPPH